MDDFQLTTGQIASLKALHRLQRDRKKAYRVNAIILLGSGWTVAQVAEALFVDEKTVRIWYEKYLHGGENELLTLCYSGKEPLLSETQQQELAKHLDEHTYLDSKAVAHYIEKTVLVCVGMSPTCSESMQILTDSGQIEDGATTFLTLEEMRRILRDNMSKEELEEALINLLFHKTYG